MLNLDNLIFINSQTFEEFNKLPFHLTMGRHSGPEIDDCHEITLTSSIDNSPVLSVDFANEPFNSISAYS